MSKEGEQDTTESTCKGLGLEDCRKFETLKIDQRVEIWRLGSGESFES